MKLYEILDEMSPEEALEIENEAKKKVRNKEKALIVLQRRNPVRLYTYFVCILMAVLFFALFRKNISDFALSNKTAYFIILIGFGVLCIVYSGFLAKKEEIEVFGMKL